MEKTNQTLRQFADANGLKATSLTKKMFRWATEGEIEKAYGLNDILPEEVIEKIISGKETAQKPILKPVKKPYLNPVLPLTLPANHFTLPTDVPTPQTEETKSLFEDKPTIHFAAFILIAADAISCAWIAWNTYQNFQLIAAILFGLAGMAIGYSAIRVIVTYSGFNRKAYAWGFGIFQWGLHLCAMSTFGPDYSFYVGKVMISCALPISTSAIAVALKTTLKK